MLSHEDLTVQDEKSALKNAPIHLCRTLSILLLLILLPLVAIYCCQEFFGGFFQVEIINETVTEWVGYFSGIVLVGNILYFLWLIVLRCWYQETAPVSDEELPQCTIVVPAYNEGEQVFYTLQSIIESDYPAQKLEIVAVNDGSCDDTTLWIEKALRTWPGRIQFLNCPENHGKRHAIYQGIRHSKGSAIVTVDSDSQVETDTIRKLVSPLVRDSSIGGVAGNVKVLNFEEGLIPKMLEVNFLFCFEFIRSAQSTLRAVFCSPGALSALRRSVVMPVLDEWLNQKFLGTPANIGDDRAMTNLILRSGAAVTFQRTATVYTNVPLRYEGLCKMLLRWCRSNIRENFAMFGFIFSVSNPNYSKLGAWINLLVQTLWSILPVLTLLIYLYCVIATFGGFLISTIPVVLAWASFPAIIYYLRCGGNVGGYAYLYSLFYFLTLFWVAPYALFSFHRSGWLTRDTPNQKIASHAETPEKENCEQNSRL